MRDRQISGTNAAAWTLWSLAVLAVTAGLVWPGFGLGNLGTVFGAAGGTLHVRLMVCDYMRTVHEAFETGRDAGRLEVVPSQRIR